MTTTTSTNRKHLILVGGGHAHVQVIKALNTASRPANVDVTLIDLQQSASYSGMVVSYCSSYLLLLVYLVCVILFYCISCWFCSYYDPFILSVRLLFI